MSPLDKIYCGPAFVEAHSVLEGKLKIRKECTFLLHVEQLLWKYQSSPYLSACRRRARVPGQPGDSNSSPWMREVSLWKQALEGTHVSSRGTAEQSTPLAAGGTCWGRMGVPQQFCVAGKTSWKFQDMKLDLKQRSNHSGPCSMRTIYYLWDAFQKLNV